MSPYKLRWLTLVSLLGLAGIPLHQPCLYALFGFGLFSPCFWMDERAEGNFRRAASFAYVVTLIALMATFLLLGAMRAVGATSFDMLRMLALALALTYSVHLLSFAASYIYFDVKGT